MRTITMLRSRRESALGKGFTVSLWPMFSIPDTCQWLTVYLPETLASKKISFNQQIVQTAKEIEDGRDDDTIYSILIGQGVW